MNKIKVIDLLKTFNKADFKRFGDFAASPFFNKLQNVTRFYDAIKEFYPDFSSSGFTKEVVFKTVFPGEAYNDGRFRALCSHLFSLAEKFLAYSRYSSDEVNLRLDIIKVLSRPGYQ